MSTKVKKPKLKKLRVKKLRFGGGYQGSKAGPVERGGGRNPSAQFSGGNNNVSQASRDAVAAQRKTARETISPSTTTSSVIGRALMSAFIPGSGYVAGKIQDSVPYWRRSNQSKAVQDFKIRDGDGNQNQNVSLAKVNTTPQPLFAPTTPTTASQAVSKFMIRPGVALSGNKLGMNGQMFPVPPTGKFMIKPGVALSDVAKASNGKLIKGHPKLAKKGWK